MMNRQPLDIYDEMPSQMKKYISNYGWHFNKKAYEYATQYMRTRRGKTTPFTRELVLNMLKSHNIELENDMMYDSTYVAFMGACDYLGSSIIDEKHLAMFVKDTIDDVDASDTTTFRRWVATMIGNGVAIDWEELV